MQVGNGLFKIANILTKKKKMAPFFAHCNHYLYRNSLRTVSKFSPDSQPKLQISDEREDSDGPNISQGKKGRWNWLTSKCRKSGTLTTNMVSEWGWRDEDMAPEQMN